MSYNTAIEKIYKKSDTGSELKLYINIPEDNKKDRPAMIFFHGAGFSNNKSNASQFQHHAEYFTSRGLVTICAEYRPLDVEGLYSPIDSLYNAKSAIRWIRENSELLGINTNKVIAAGASAGGYLSLCSAMIDHFNDPSDNIMISSKPNATVIFNGGVDSNVLINLFPELSDDLRIASPINHIRENLPPCILFHGTQDVNIRLEEIINFSEINQLKGNLTRLVTFEGLGHGFFNYGVHENKPYIQTIQETETFLKEINMWG
ncbi:alpha/beta hydrolase [Paenibacillus sp. GCM10028914]|uniref:alpha/beta hydrolase n=1 Tax=Paenibacillus sp. GCM10028914 TaxID=3273416 RepID=UPI00360CC08A